MIKSKARGGRGLIFFILLILLLGIFLSIHRYTISGNSMNPTLPESTQVWVESLSYGIFAGSTPLLLWGKPKRNTIVQYYHTELVVKRCIGVPGDSIIVEDNTIILHNQQYQIARSVAETLHSITSIPEGYYFFVGDNLSASTDSRHYGLVPRDAICGRVWRFAHL